MKSLFGFTLALAFTLLTLPAAAQEENSITREIELGALITSGNTEEESLNFAAAVNIVRDKWEYDFSLDGLYTTTDSEVKGQRYYGVASANYSISDFSYFQSRLSHEDDRFSGFDSQSDITFSYGRELLRDRGNMELNLNAGAGMRYSRIDDDDFEEPILRFAGDYTWTISDSARLTQELASEFGTDSNIYRSETGIETRILENLSLRFSLRVKHQTDVPATRKKTDTETAVTFVMNF